MLEALYPGRIDLGIGRAPGGDQRTARAVGGGHLPDAEQFPQQVWELVGHLDGTLPADHPFKKCECSLKERPRPSSGCWDPPITADCLPRSSACAFRSRISSTRRAGIWSCAPTRIDTRHRGESPNRIPRSAVLSSARNRTPKPSALRGWWMCGASTWPTTSTRSCRRRSRPGSAASTQRSAPHPLAARASRARQRDTCKEKLLAIAEKFSADELMVLTITGDYANAAAVLRVPRQGIRAVAAVYRRPADVRQRPPRARARIGRVHTARLTVDEALAGLRTARDGLASPEAGRARPSTARTGSQEGEARSHGCCALARQFIVFLRADLWSPQGSPSPPKRSSRAKAWRCSRRRS